MKVEFSEDPDGFWLNLEAESVEDVRLLVRYGLNRTKELRYAEVFAPKDGPVVAQVSLGIRKERSSLVAFTK